MSTKVEKAGQPKSPLREIVQPFIDLVHAPRALWGINLGYLIEGFCYFGILLYLGMYFRQYAGLDDVWSQRSKGIMTAGITIAMFFFGGRADKWGVRFALLAAFVLLIFGRGLLAFAPLAGGTGFSSPMYLLAVAGILLVVLGYGMYQPAAYAAVRQFTTPATAGMGFAMLYALMNLGGWLPSFMTPVRTRFGIGGAYWFYAGLTIVSLVVTWLILSRRTVERAIAAARAKAGQTETKPASAGSSGRPGRSGGGKFVPGPGGSLVREPPAGQREVRVLHLLSDPGADPLRIQLRDLSGVRRPGVHRAGGAAAAGIPVPAVAPRQPAPGAQSRNGSVMRICRRISGRN